MMRPLLSRTRWGLAACAALAFLVLATTGCQNNTVDTPAEVDEQLAQSETNLPGYLPVPTFDSCSGGHPELPAKWQATALMQDFFHNSLTFGKFVYDEGAGAFRSQLADRYRLGTDLLVTEDGRMYVLFGGSNPTSCYLASQQSPFTVPTRDWLADGAQCVGKADILERQQEWWKTPSGEGANWFWFNADNRLPFRSMYYVDQPITTPVPIYEHFTFNYFPIFEEVPSTDLSDILAMCERSAETQTETASGVAYDMDFVDNWKASSTYPEPNEDSIAQVGGWIPGLSECGSINDLPPNWPDKVQLTAYMTAVSFPPNPFPTRVIYDWTQKAQNSSLYYNPPTPEEYVQVALLTGDTGYIRIQNSQGDVTMCQQALPGPQVPNWKKVDGCECRARLAPGSILNPSSEHTNILWCPTDLSADQVFWTWYGDSGTPVVFMQSNSSPTDGTGLNLADYTAWAPNMEPPTGIFDLPAACNGQPKVDVPPACHNCHLPTNSGAGS